MAEPRRLRPGSERAEARRPERVGVARCRVINSGTWAPEWAGLLLDINSPRSRSLPLQAIPSHRSMNLQTLNRVAVGRDPCHKAHRTHANSSGPAVRAPAVTSTAGMPLRNAPREQKADPPRRRPPGRAGWKPGSDGAWRRNTAKPSGSTQLIPTPPESSAGKS